MRRDTSPVVYWESRHQEQHRVPRKLFALLRSRAELLAKVPEYFILQSRFTANEIFYGFGEGNLIGWLLEFPGGDDRLDL